MYTYIYIRDNMQHSIRCTHVFCHNEFVNGAGACILGSVNLKEKYIANILQRINFKTITSSLNFTH